MFKKIGMLMAGLITSAAMAAVDINKATEAELDGLSGIGPATTQLILNERKKREFKDWDDVMKRIKGIGEARAAKLSAAGLTVAGHSYKGQAPAPTAKSAAPKPAVLTPAAVQPADPSSAKPSLTAK